MAWTTPRTWVNLEVVAHTTMNTHVRDNIQYLKDVLDGVQSQAITFKPVSSTALTLTNTLATDNLQLRFRGNASAVDQWAIGNEIATGAVGRNFDFYDLVAGANRLRITSGGQFQFGDGSASTPVLSFSADTDTGIYREAADSLAIVAGAQRIIWPRLSGGLSQLGFHGSSPVTKPTTSGSRAGNAALASLLTALNSMGLLNDGSTA